MDEWQHDGVFSPVEEYDEAQQKAERTELQGKAK
jgi:hypothetical protein